mmetsp:Transcript_21334/g.47186  ORF Transcript_21334/g.47186 Transcript_21334/m.47186 type:complete len:143 (-) Transcript_21334:9-437(-)
MSRIYASLSAVVAASALILCSAQSLGSDVCAGSACLSLLQVKAGAVVPAAHGIEVHYTEFDNYCVSRMGNDLKQDAGHQVTGGIEECKALCDARADCHGFEWYEAGWRQSQCFLVSGQEAPLRGSLSSFQWRDAKCFVKTTL